MEKAQQNLSCFQVHTCIPEGGDEYNTGLRLNCIPPLGLQTSMNRCQGAIWKSYEPTPNVKYPLIDTNCFYAGYQPDLNPYVQRYGYNEKTSTELLLLRFFVVPPGIEPGTQGFSVLCSTN